MQKFLDRQKNRKAKGSTGESVLVAIFSAVGFMVWGLWVNWDYSFASRVQVALTQAGISLVATFSAAELLRGVARLFFGMRRRRFLTAFIGWILINILVFFAHWTCGTPEILKTMLLGMIGGILFCWFYGTRLSRASI